MTDPFDLYRRALTHASFTAERGGDSYERLEFLGDAVLQLAVSEMLFERYPDDDPGTLHNRRKQMVQNEALADVARELDLLSIARIGRGEARNTANRSVKLEADLVEALLGAVYLDQGWEVARAVIQARWRRRLGRTRQRAADPKIKLQELSHQRSGQHPTYRLVDQSGPDHSRLFTMAVEVDGAELGRGEGTSKKSAERAAAAEALARLQGDGAT